MSAKALTYAEDTLGVHKVYEEVEAHLTSLDTMLGDLDKALDVKRDLTDQQDQREVELIGEKRGTHPDISDTRFNALLKEWKREDGELTRIRIELGRIQGEVQGIEFDVDLTRLRIKAGCARMEQLGGYLHYLAAVKQGARNQAEQKTKPTEEGSE